jgi:hypothetical protein
MIRRSACNLGRYHANRAVELHEQSRKLGPTEWGLTAIWRCENFVSAMSLLGQLRRSDHVCAKSGVPPIAAHCLAARPKQGANSGPQPPFRNTGNRSGFFQELPPDVPKVPYTGGHPVTCL